jgi:hypothetical protein
VGKRYGSLGANNYSGSRVGFKKQRQLAMVTGDDLGGMTLGCAMHFSG